VLSTMGAMFVPDQEKVASEMLRFCRPSEDQHGQLDTQ